MNVPTKHGEHIEAGPADPTLRRRATTNSHGREDRSSRELLT